MSAAEFPAGGFPVSSPRSRIRTMAPYRTHVPLDERCQALVNVTGPHAGLIPPRACKLRGKHVDMQTGKRYCIHHYKREVVAA